jgi:hypothetical protein
MYKCDFLCVYTYRAYICVHICKHIYIHIYIYLLIIWFYSMTDSPSCFYLCPSQEHDFWSTLYMYIDMYTYMYVYEGKFIDIFTHVHIYTHMYISI